MTGGSEGPYAGSVGFVDGSPTSEESADKTTFAAALRAQVFALIERNNGCTRGELFDLFDGKYQASTLSARICELQLAGRIRDSGVVRFYPRTKRNHTVWVAAAMPRKIKWDGKQWVDQ